MLGHSRCDYVGDFVDIGVVADGEIHLDPVGAALVGIVDDAGGNEILVRHHDPAAVKRLKDHRPRGGLDDGTCLAIVEFDVIANRRLPFEQQNDTRDVIRCNLLQAEAEAHTNCTPKNGERGERHAHDVHQQEERDAEDDQLRRFRSELPRGGAHLFLFVNVGGGLVVRPAAQPEQKRACDQAAQQGHD